MLDEENKVLSVEVVKLKAPGCRTWGYRFILLYIKGDNEHTSVVYDVEFDFIPTVLENYLNHFVTKTYSFTFINGICTTENKEYYNLPVINVTGNQKRMNYLFSLLSCTPMLCKDLRLNTKKIGFVEGLCILLESVVYESNHPDSEPNYVINLIGEDDSAYQRLFTITGGISFLCNKFAVLQQKMKTNENSQTKNRIRVSQRDLLELLVNTKTLLGVTQETAIYFDSPYESNPLFFTYCDVMDSTNQRHFNFLYEVKTSIEQSTLQETRLQEFITFADICGCIQFLPGKSINVLDVLNTHQHINIESTVRLSK